MVLYYVCNNYTLCIKYFHPMHAQDIVVGLVLAVVVMISGILAAYMANEWIKTVYSTVTNSLIALSVSSYLKLLCIMHSLVQAYSPSTYILILLLFVLILVQYIVCS